MMRDYAGIPGALFRPDRAFAGRAVYMISKPFLVLMLFLLYVGGERMVQGHFLSSHAKMLAILEADTRVDGFMRSAPPEAQARARDQILSSIVGPRNRIVTAVTIALSGVGFILVILEMWLACIVISQFFGGQEERHGRDRPSLTLFLISSVPFALRKLLSGIVISLRPPDAAANALTLSEYRRLSAARFDFFSLLPMSGVPDFLAALARFLTDPFSLWAFAILWFGGGEVFHMRQRNALFQTLVLVALMSLQAALFARIGLQWEM